MLLGMKRSKGRRDLWRRGRRGWRRRRSGRRPLWALVALTRMRYEAGKEREERGRREGRNEGRNGGKRRRREGEKRM